MVKTNLLPKKVNNKETLAGFKVLEKVEFCELQKHPQVKFKIRA